MSFFEESKLRELLARHNAKSFEEYIQNYDESMIPVMKAQGYLYNTFEITEKTILITNSDGGHGYTPYVFKEIAKALHIKRHEHFWDAYHVNQLIKSYFKSYSEQLVEEALQAVYHHQKGPPAECF